MARLKRWEPIVITWTDATTLYEPAQSDRDDFSPSIRKTIGFFIKRDSTSITVAMEDDRTADFGDADCQTVTTIPKQMVRSVMPLIPAPVPPKKPRPKKVPVAE